VARGPVIECRIRFLSFVSIYQYDARICAFIQQTANGSFLCHVIRCEPDAVAFCNTVRAACELRYQQCLDARGRTTKRETEDAQKRDVQTFNEVRPKENGK
ncbi:hypothetical protein EG68_10046, partial [Paragonimus skrjabini miyazakii]